MSSLGDIQQMYSMLQEMDRMLSRINTGLNDAEINAKKTQEQFDRLESIALRYMVIVGRLGLPEDANMLLQKVAMMIIALKQLEMTIIATQAVLAGSGPVGWLALGASATYTALSFYALGNS